MPPPPPYTVRRDGDRGRGRRPRTRAPAIAAAAPVVPRARFVRSVRRRAVDVHHRDRQEPYSYCIAAVGHVDPVRGEKRQNLKNRLSSRVTCSTTRLLYFFVLTWLDIPRKRFLGPVVCKITDQPKLYTIMVMGDASFIWRTIFLCHTVPTLYCFHRPINWLIGLWLFQYCYLLLCIQHYYVTSKVGNRALFEIPILVFEVGT